MRAAQDGTANGGVRRAMPPRAAFRRSYNFV